MLQFFIISALLFIKDSMTQSCVAENKYPWSYHGTTNDPYYWKFYYPDCGQNDQSPIEIWHRDVQNVDLERLEYSGFNEPITKATVRNVGWTVMVSPEDNANRYIKWGEDIYTLEQIHLHFGTKINPGAEHPLEGIRYEMEIHYVTHLDKDPRKRAVVASLMQVNDLSNPGLDPIIEVLSQIRYKDDVTELKTELNLAGLLPQDCGSYFFYLGSDAVPPCEPGYVWWILKEISIVGKAQLDELMKLYSVGAIDASEMCLMGPNYRPVQDTDNRPILSSK